MDGGRGAYHVGADCKSAVRFACFSMIFRHSWHQDAILHGHGYNLGDHGRNLISQVENFYNQDGILHNHGKIMRHHVHNLRHQDGTCLTFGGHL